MRAINFTKIELGDNNYHLIFRGHVPSQNTNQIFRFDFTGTEVETNALLDTEEKKNLVNLLADDYGFGPFNIDVVRNKFEKNKKQYRV